MTDTPTESPMGDHLAALGWTQNELARRLGVTPKQVSAWRTGKTKGVPAYVLAYLDLAVRWQKACERFPGLLQ